VNAGTDTNALTAYPFRMTPKFKRILEAAFWFVVGFVTHLLLYYYHHHPAGS
jgi:hypothetical protein